MPGAATLWREAAAAATARTGAGQEREPASPRGREAARRQESAALQGLRALGRLERASTTPGEADEAGEDGRDDGQDLAGPRGASTSDDGHAAAP